MSARQFETHCWATNEMRGSKQLTDRPQVEIVSTERRSCRCGIVSGV
jgi:hypothetical protein